MSVGGPRGLVLGAVAGVGAAVTTGVLLDRRLAARRRGPGPQTSAVLGSLRGRVETVVADDGLHLYAEVDELAPYGTHSAGEGSATIVFAHGFALNLDCWHYQREAFRGGRRMVFYDQRSHGRSEESAHDRATIDQLGKDLKAVIDTLAPDQDVVLVGHSMGGMAIVALAEQHPELFGERVVGVALVSTTAGGMRTHQLVSRFMPETLGRRLVERGLLVAAHRDSVLELARKGTSPLSIRVIHEFAFGDSAVSLDQIRFLDQMIGATPLKVLVEFIPQFDLLDKFAAVLAFERVQTWILAGTKDKIVAIGHARKLKAHIEGSHLVEFEGGGHMPIFECAAEVNETLGRLFAAADGTLEG